MRMSVVYFVTTVLLVTPMIVWPMIALAVDASPVPVHGPRHDD